MFVLMRIFFPEYVQVGIGKPFRGLLLGGGILAVIAFVDELGSIYHRKFRLSPLVRLGIQVGVALIAYLVSGVGIESFVLPGGMVLEFGPLSQVVLTIAWYLIFINAINFFDGINGLASGMSSI